MQVGQIYHGTESYGGSYHDLGLYRVVKLGKKFASLKQIESKKLEEPVKQSSCLDSSYQCKKQARLPIKPIPDTTNQLVSFVDFNEEDNCAIVANGGAQCSKKFELVNADEHGNYCFLASAQHYY